MSRRNGQRARFQINRKRKLLKRVRTRAVAAVPPSPAASADTKTEK